MCTFLTLVIKAFLLCMIWPHRTSWAKNLQLGKYKDWLEPNFWQFSKLFSKIWNDLISSYCKLFKIRYWKSLQNLLGSLINSIEAIVSLLVLLFLFLGIFALLGTQVFGGKFRERKVSGRGFSKPRANFDTFSESFYAVFQVTFTEINTSNVG